MMQGEETIDKIAMHHACITIRNKEEEIRRVPHGV